MGWVGYSGDMDFNILIRTLVLKDGWAHLQVGAGIVADSRPEREFEESLQKGKALLKALSFSSFSASPRFVGRGAGG